MDSDWCLFCEKHVQDLGALYCSKECARMDILTAVANKSSNSASSSMPPGHFSPLASSNASASSSLSLRRSVQQPLTVSYPCMFRSSSLVPASIYGRATSGHAFSPIPAPAPGATLNGGLFGCGQPTVIHG